MEKKSHISDKRKRVVYGKILANDYVDLARKASGARAYRAGKSKNVAKGQKEFEAMTSKFRKRLNNKERDNYTKYKWNSYILPSVANRILSCMGCDIEVVDAMPILRFFSLCKTLEYSKDELLFVLTSSYFPEMRNISRRHRNALADMVRNCWDKKYIICGFRFAGDIDRKYPDWMSLENPPHF